MEDYLVPEACTHVFGHQLQMSLTDAVLCRGKATAGGHSIIVFTSEIFRLGITLADFDRKLKNLQASTNSVMTFKIGDPSITFLTVYVIKEDAVTKANKEGFCIGGMFIQL